MSTRPQQTTPDQILKRGSVGRRTLDVPSIAQRDEWASVARERARDRALGTREAKLEATLKDVRDALAAPSDANDRILNAQVFLEWLP